MRDSALGPDLHVTDAIIVCSPFDGQCVGYICARRTKIWNDGEKYGEAVTATTLLVGSDLDEAIYSVNFNVIASINQSGDVDLRLANDRNTRQDRALHQRWVR